MTTIAEELAKHQKEISISEFFTRNRHLLGFDNPARALLMTVKEAVDNSLDACAETGVLPEIIVQISELSESRYKIIVEDNGPGIVKEQIPNIFAKLLYGSKFHRLRQSLTEDELIFIKRNGKAELIPIGNFVNSLLSDGEIKNISSLNIEVPAFDPKTNKYSMQKISHIIKHKRENEILNIKTEYNKEIKVTGCHSLFAFNDKSKKIESVEARSLKTGDYIVVPKKLPEIDNLKEINILDYIEYEDIKKNWAYVYGIKHIVESLKEKSEIIHKKVDKSRRFYRIKNDGFVVDILDDSMKMYLKKGFLPLQIVYQLGLKKEVADGYIITYKHGDKYKLPVTLSLNKDFMRFLGIYLAEGHSDKRQLGLTFGKHEQSLINEITNFAQMYGLGVSLEQRERSIRVKLFNNLFVKIIENICSKGAHNKKIPEFVFRVDESLRWHFIDGYCQGDGHKVKGRNSLMFSTKSRNLAVGLQYLFLMNGVTSSYSSSLDKGLGKQETLTHKVVIHGSSLNGSHVYKRDNSRPTKRIIEYNNGKVLGVLQQEFDSGDLSFVKINEIKTINEGYEYVYDVSVPEFENFVGGIGGISCHNSRGQQGIGISASVLYSQLTTGKSTKIISKIGAKKPAHYFELKINTKTNNPEIEKDEIIDWEKSNGTRIELELEAKYQKGKQSVDEYIKQTAIVNPHATFIYTNSEKEKFEFIRVTNKLPVEAKEIKPHPHGTELGTLMSMLQDTKARTVQQFLQTDFCRIGASLAKNILKQCNIIEKTNPKNITHEQAELLFKTLQSTKIIAPPTDCLSPIGADLLEKGLKKEINADFYVTTTRPPTVYRGMPFQIEAGIAYGGEIDKEGAIRVMRFANRVPLLYQLGACSITESITETNWKPYGLQQSGSNVPTGPAVILIHISSVWVPFTSEAKEAIAHYPEIIKEIKLALQECGRKLASYIRKNVKAKENKDKINLFEKYIPELANSLANLTDNKKEDIQDKLKKLLKKELPTLEAENGAEKE